jgi:hypothetical protein
VGLKIGVSRANITAPRSRRRMYSKTKSTQKSVNMGILGQKHIAEDEYIYCINLLRYSWCGYGDLNPNGFLHRNLNPACLPIPSYPLMMNGLYCLKQCGPCSILTYTRAQIKENIILNSHIAFHQICMAVSKAVVTAFLTFPPPLPEQSPMT